MAQKSVFLTGSTGHLGQYVLRELLKKDYHVQTLVRAPEGSLSMDGVRVCPGTLADIAKWHQEIEASDGIIHLAASRSSSREIVLSEDVGSMNALTDYWKKGNFVYASSQVVYGTPPAPLMDESTRLAPQTWYDLGKVFGEFVVRARPYTALQQHDQVAGHWEILRIPLLIGTNSKMGDRQVFHSIFEHAAAGKPFVFRVPEEEARVYGSSWASCALTARAFVAALGMPAAAIINVSSGFIFWVDLLESVIRRLNSKSRMVFQKEGALSADEYLLPHAHSELDVRRMRTLFDLQEEAFEFYLEQALNQFLLSIS